VKRLACLLGLSCWLASSQALAIEPAGGPAVPPGMDPLDFISPADLPDASVEDRTWFGQDARGDEPRLTASPSSHNPLLSVLALLLVAALGGGALWLQRRKSKTSPLGTVESRLMLLSSTRVGPKAFAVSAEVNGRVLLLGVTDHQVTNLGWLDPPELEPADVAEEPEPEAAIDADDLPDDYPGSALRAAARQASQLDPTSLPPPSLQPSPLGSSQHFASSHGFSNSHGLGNGHSLTNSQNLRRFQEVLRGAMPDKSNPLRAPRLPTPSSELLGRSAPPLGSDAASTLAAQTSDVLQSDGSAGGRSVAPASLRRKRQRRQELTSKPAKPSARVAPESAPPGSIEGQVAGLRALKKG
jgi:flagellar biogenesis protein FliO